MTLDRLTREKIAELAKRADAAALRRAQADLDFWWSLVDGAGAIE